MFEMGSLELEGAGLRNISVCDRKVNEPGGWRKCLAPRNATEKRKSTGKKEEHMLE